MPKNPHEWQINPDGLGKDDIWFGDEYPYASCRFCSQQMEQYGKQGERHEECPGVDLDITIKVLIGHPGKAVAEDDREYIRDEFVIPLAELFDDAGAVERCLNKAVAAALRKWRQAAAHHDPQTGWPDNKSDWRAAVAAKQERGQA